MEKSFLEERVQGLAFRTLPDSARALLRLHRIETAKDLLPLSDSTLLQWGMPKNGMRAIDRVLKVNGLKRGMRKEKTAAALRILTRESVIPEGRYAGHRVGELIGACKHRVLRYLYYNVAYIDFTQEVKDAIHLTRPIPKPGVSRETMQQCNEDNEAKMHGLSKLKIMSHISKQIRTENALRRKTEARMFTKAALQAANHGHLAVDMDEEDERGYDNRLFAGVIIKHGYDQPRRRAGRKKTAPETAAASPQERTALWMQRARMFRQELLDAIPETYVHQGREFLANIQITEYIYANHPDEADGMLPQLLFTDFLAPEYFETLLGLGLPYTKMKDILDNKETHMDTVIVRDAASGEDVFIRGATIRTDTDRKNHTISLNFFDEETFETSDIRTFLGRTTEADAPTMTEYAASVKRESFAVSLTNIGRMLETAVRDAGGELCTHVPRSSIRQPRTFDLKVSATGLSIREHSDDWREYRFAPFTEWARDNESYLLSIHERIASSTMEGLSEAPPENRSWKTKVRTLLRRCLKPTGKLS